MGRQVEHLSRVLKSCLQVALFAAFILPPHMLLIQATIRTETKILVTWEPSRPQTNANLTLIPGGASRTLSCSWYRGHTTAKEKKIISSSLFRHKKGKSYTGRETAGPNCSLHIRNLTALDSGNYTVKKKTFSHLEIGHAYVEISDPSLSMSSPGTISGVVIGLLLAMTAGIGTLSYFFLRGRERGSWWRIRPNRPILAPAKPVNNLYQTYETPVLTSSTNEYVLPSTRAEPQVQVESSHVFDPSQRYQILQVPHGNQDVYHDLRKPYPPPPGSFFRPFILFKQSHVLH